MPVPLNISAAEILEEQAAALRAKYTLSGAFFDKHARDEHDDLLVIAARLRDGGAITFTQALEALNHRRPA